MCAEDLQFWNKLDIPVYYAVGSRANPPAQGGLQKLPAFNAKQENASKSPVVKVDNSQFPQLLVVQEVRGAAGNAGLVYEFKKASGDPIPKGTKLYVRLIQGKTSPEFTKQTYVLNNIDDADIAFIAGKGSKTLGVSQDQFFSAFGKAIDEKNLADLKAMFQRTDAQDINARDKFGATPLMLAARKDYLPLMQFLVEKKAGINVQDNSGNTVLHYALSDKYKPIAEEVVRFLIENGAPINVSDKQGRTPLSKAAENISTNAVNSVKLLINAGANVYAYNPKFGYALDAAKKSRNAPVIQLLESTMNNIPVHIKKLAYEVLEVRENAADAEILGLSQEQLKNTNAVTKAFFARFGNFTPFSIDKVPQPAQDDVKKLSDAEKDALGYTVKKFLIDAQDRAHKEQTKTAKISTNISKMTPQEFVAFAATASPREILGVTSNADEATIGKAFRTMSLKFHPDKWPNESATATDAYQRIVHARDNLLGKK